MAKLTRGERMIKIFVYLMAHYNNRYTITEIMHNLDIPESDLRSIQRDMQSLIDVEGCYIRKLVEFGKTYYQVALEKANKLIFPEFDDVLLHFVFLQRIANLYPSCSLLINDLIDTIQKSLPKAMQDSLKRHSKALNNRIIFMGTLPNIDEDSGKKIQILLEGIRTNRLVEIDYTDNFGNRTNKLRIPLMLIVYQGEIYVGCVSKSSPGATYALKCCRMESVKLTKKHFVEDPSDIENLRKRVRTGSFLMGEQNPKDEEVEIYFAGYAKNILNENPYHRSMKIEKLPCGDLRVKMKVEVNELLKQWVMYYGPIAEVLKPDSLKQMICESAQQLVCLYSSKKA